MNAENLEQRLAYFEEKRELAKTRYAAREAHPSDFDAADTTERFKTWRESIALIDERILAINIQLRAKEKTGSRPLLN
jgi:hypothetical protein